MSRGVLICFVFLALIGCTTTPTDLAAQEDHKESWKVNADAEKVFKTYKRYIEDTYTARGLLGEYVGQESHFYGDNAEIAIKMIGNPIARVTYLYFRIHEDGGVSSVDAWYYNRPWKMKIQDFKDLFPENR